MVLSEPSLQNDELQIQVYLLLENSNLPSHLNPHFQQDCADQDCEESCTATLLSTKLVSSQQLRRLPELTRFKKKN